jgi:hypothetical protein
LPLRAFARTRVTLAGKWRNCILKLFRRARPGRFRKSCASPR